MRRIRIIVITIHYAPIIIYAQKPNTKMAEDHPCIAALMVGMAGTINILTEISQTPHIQECYSQSVKTVYEEHDFLHTGDMYIVLSFIQQKIDICS